MSTRFSKLLVASLLTLPMVGLDASRSMAETTSAEPSLLKANAGVTLVDEVLLPGNMVLAETATGYTVAPAGSSLSRELTFDSDTGGFLARNSITPPEPATAEGLELLREQHQAAGWTINDYADMINRALAGESISVVAATSFPSGPGDAEVFSDGCQYEQDGQKTNSNDYEPISYSQLGCFDRRYGEQTDLFVYVGDHSYSTARSFNGFYMNRIRVGHHYANADIVTFSPDHTSATNCSTNTVGFAAFGISASFNIDICPTRIDPVLAPRDFTTSWVGSSVGRTDAVHQAGTMKKVQGVSSGYTWEQSSVVSGCGHPVACFVTNLLLG